MDILFKYKTADIADRRMFCVLIFFFLIRCHKCNCNRRRAILIPTNMYIIVIFYGIPNAMDGSMAFWRSQIAQFSGSVRLWFLTSQINERRWINWNDRIQMAQCGSSGMACAATTVMATDGTEECYNIIKRSFNTTDRWSTASDKRRCLNTFFFITFLSRQSHCSPSERSIGIWIDAHVYTAHKNSDCRGVFFDSNIMKFILCD